MVSTTSASTSTEKITTLAPELELYNEQVAFILGVSLALGIPLLVFIICLIKALVAHTREKKIADDEEHFQHPAPSAPLPRLPFFRREGTIAGPFGNPTFNPDDEEDDDGRVVTPSFISTNIVSGPAFGAAPQRYQYIP